MRESEEHYRSLFANMLNGYAYCKMHFEQNRPVDFTYLTVNTAFENLTGLKNVAGKRVSEVIPGSRESNSELFEIYGRVASTGLPERFETYVEPLKMWFEISVYRPQKEHFVAVFDVITARKRAEEALQKAHDELEQRVAERTEELRLAVEVLQEEVIERQQAEEAIRVSHHFLEMMNRHTKLPALLQDFVAEVKNLTQCEAVGIRLLDEAGNIPYQDYEGFSKEFYEMESPLSIHSDQCMCINVIKGTTDRGSRSIPRAAPFYERHHPLPGYGVGRG